VTCLSNLCLRSTPYSALVVGATSAKHHPCLARQACCTLLPAFPDFPEERSATIEANIVNQNFTFVARYMASQRFAGVRGRLLAAPAAHHSMYAGTIAACIAAFAARAGGRALLWAVATQMCSE